MSQICPHCGQGFKRLASHEYRCKEKKATSLQLPSTTSRPSQSKTLGKSSASSSRNVTHMGYPGTPSQTQAQRTGNQKCPDCGKTFVNLANHKICHGRGAVANSHLKTECQNCPDCGKTFVNLANHKICHGRGAVSNTHLKTECQKYPVSSKTFTNLTNHKTCHGRGAVANPTQSTCGATQPCPDCGKMFKNLANHNVCHGRKSVATSVKPAFVKKQMCPDCGGVYKNRANHKVCRGRKSGDCVVKSVFVEMQVCFDCGKCFKNLAKHRICHGRDSRRSVTNVVVHKCRDCGKCFKNISNHKVCRGRETGKCKKKKAKETREWQGTETPPPSPSSEATVRLTSSPPSDSSDQHPTYSGPNCSPPHSQSLLTPPPTPEHVTYSAGDTEEEEEEAEEEAEDYEEEGEIREEESDEEEGEIIEDEEYDENPDYDEEERPGGGQRRTYAQREDSDDDDDDDDDDEEEEYDPGREGILREVDEDDEEEIDETDEEEEGEVLSSRFLHQSDEEESDDHEPAPSSRDNYPRSDDPNAGLDDEEALAVALRESLAHDQSTSTKWVDVKQDADIPRHTQKPEPVPVRTEGTARVVFDLETTGFDADSHITQIAADHAMNRFSMYVFPDQPITNGAQRVTGLKVIGQQMFKHNNQVTAVSIEKAMSLFLDYLRSLDRPALLIGHNSKNFDGRVLVNAIEKCGMVEEFRKYLAGFVDTLPLLKELYPKRKSYKQFDIYVDVMGGVYDAHDAVADVVALRDLLAAPSVRTDTWDRHSFSMQYIIDSLGYLKAKKSLLVTFGPLTGYVSPGMMEKMAGSGLGLHHLRLAFLRGGRGGLAALLSEDIGGTARITKSKFIIDTIYDFFYRRHSPT